MLIHLGNKEQFKEVVSKGITLVDFFATWCGPCRMLTPELEKLAEKDQAINVLKIDVDEFQELASQFNVRAVPTLVLFKDGQVVTTGSGFRPLASLEQFVAQAK